MLVCLTSGKRPRYREDVTRALALPRGGVVQFRYGEDIVEEETRRRISAGTAKGDKVVICFIYANEERQFVSVLPLRFGTLQAGRRVGSSVILEIALADFVRNSGETDIRAGLSSARPGIVPATTRRARDRNSRGCSPSMCPTG